MSSPNIARYAQQELKYQIRGEIARGIRKGCPKGDPMVSCITIMLCTVLTMAAFNRIFNPPDEGRTR